MIFVVIRLPLIFILNLIFLINWTESESVILHLFFYRNAVISNVQSIRIINNIGLDKMTNLLPNFLIWLDEILLLNVCQIQLKIIPFFLMLLLPCQNLFLHSS